MFEPIQRPFRLSPGGNWPTATTWYKRSEFNAPKLLTSLESSKALGYVLFILTALILAAVTLEFWLWPLGLMIGLIGFRIAFQRFCSKLILSDRFTPEPKLDDDEYLVDLVIYIQGKAIGKDTGVVGIDEDAMFFAGKSCSFALGAQDIDLSHSFEKYWRSSLMLPEGATLLTVRHPDSHLELTIRKSVPNPFLDRPPGHDLFLTLKRFASHSKPTQKPRSFPPIEPRQQERTERRDL